MPSLTPPGGGGSVARAGMGEPAEEGFMRGTRILSFATIALLAGLSTAAFAEEPPAVPLPPPQTDGGKPLMQALKLRASARAFAPDPLPAQTLSNLLWAAWGVNRPGEGKRTAPSARNWQEIDLYVVMDKGAYLYDATAHQLKPVVSGDIRATAGTQDFVKDVPLNVVFVADRKRMKDARPEQVEAYAMADAAFVSQNVYLFCASEGLATVVRASVDKAAFAKAAKLADDQLVVFAQSVGYPKK
jgi:SagB-type dehydrogenase family enzyme